MLLYCFGHSIYLLKKGAVPYFRKGRRTNFSSVPQQFTSNLRLVPRRYQFTLIHLAFTHRLLHIVDAQAELD